MSGRRVSEVGALFSRQASQLRGHDDGVTGGSGIGVAERALSRSLPLNLPHCVLLLLIYHHYYISLGNDHSASFYWEKNFYMIVFFRDERPLSEAVWCKPFVWNLLS